MDGHYRGNTWELPSHPRTNVQDQFAERSLEVEREERGQCGVYSIISRATSFIINTFMEGGTPQLLLAVNCSHSLMRHLYSLYIVISMRY